MLHLCLMYIYKYTRKSDMSEKNPARAQHMLSMCKNTRKLDTSKKPRQVEFTYAKYVLSITTLLHNWGVPSPKLAFNGHLFGISSAYAECVQNLPALVFGNFGFLTGGAV
jgi:hypothetical protein